MRDGPLKACSLPFLAALGASSVHSARSKSLLRRCLFIALREEETKQLWSLLRGISYDIKSDLATSSSIYSTSFQTQQILPFRARAPLCGCRLWECKKVQALRGYSLPTSGNVVFPIRSDVRSINHCLLGRGSGLLFGKKQYLLLFTEKNNALKWGLILPH